jgi:hypothetical protein
VTETNQENSGDLHADLIAGDPEVAACDVKTGP